jgi:hypothetical protein
MADHLRRPLRDLQKNQHSSHRSYARLRPSPSRPGRQAHLSIRMDTSRRAVDRQYHHPLLQTLVRHQEDYQPRHHPSVAPPLRHYHRQLYPCPHPSTPHFRPSRQRIYRSSRLTGHSTTIAVDRDTKTALMSATTNNHKIALLQPLRPVVRYHTRPRRRSSVW